MSPSRMGQLSPGDNNHPQAPGVGAAPGAEADGRGDASGTGGNISGSHRNEKTLVLPSPTERFHHLGLCYFL